MQNPPSNDPHATRVLAETVTVAALLAERFDLAALRQEHREMRAEMLRVRAAA